MIGFPFDSRVTYDELGEPIYDRAISSKPLKSLINKLFTTGVMPNPSNNLQVEAGEGMTVVVNPGFAIIEGGLKLETESTTLAVQAASENYSRIDSVILRWDENDDVRTCNFYVLQGTPSQSPVRPTLVREGSVYDIALCDIIIPANSTQITNERITDTRYEAARCGIISSISEFDTTFIYNQVQADLSSFQTNAEADFSAWTSQQQYAYETFIQDSEIAFGSWEDTQQQAFLDWFATIQDILDGDTAGHLQNEIDALALRVTTLENTVGGFDTRIGTLETNVSGYDNRIGTLETNYTTLDSTVSGHTTDISNLQTADTTTNTKFDNKLKYIDVSIGSSSWPSSTTTVNGTAYYRTSFSYTTLYDSNIEMAIAPTGTNTLPTNAEYEAYNKVRFITLDETNLKVWLYATEKPATTFKIKIKGVDL